MKAKYYIYNTYTGEGMNKEPFNNKEAAIKEGRKLALQIKSSTTIVREDYQKDIAIAICEFPYYLRELQLTIQDIYVNRIDY